MKTKVISLPSAIERQNNIAINFKNKNINYDLVDGVGVKDLIFDKDTLKYFKFLNKKIEINLNNLIKFTNRKWFRFGEIANVLAHYQVWHSLKSDKNENVYLICEDDCIPAQSFVLENLNLFDYSKIDCLYLQATTAHMQEKMTLIKNLPSVEWDDRLKIINNYTHFICEGTAAYCITKQGAQKLCDYVETVGFDGPIDNLFSRFQNFTLLCPKNIEDYFFLDSTANYSYTHTGSFEYKYMIRDVEFQTKDKLILGDM